MAAVSNIPSATATAATAGSASITVDSNSGLSPRQSSRHGARSVTPSSSWTQIVRGGDSDLVATEAIKAKSTATATVKVVTAPSLSPASDFDQKVIVEDKAENENEDAFNGNVATKSVWNKLCNGAAEIAPVMGADSWPALSDSAKASTRASDSSKGSSEGSQSVNVTQGTGDASFSSRKQVYNAAHNSSTNNMVPIRQRSTKRNASNTAFNGSAPQPPGSWGQVGEAHPNHLSPRDHPQRNFHSRPGNDQTQPQRNSFRNRNGGAYNHSYGGTRDQDHGNQDWNATRNFNSRDAHIQPQGGYSRFFRQQPPPPPPPSSLPFIPPPSLQPFGSPMGYSELPPPVYYVAPPPEPPRSLPFVAAPMPPQAVFFPPDFHLHSKIMNQIDYYFSNENLIKDTYLRRNMDDQGWVDIQLIAGFNKVSQLTDNIQLIVDALRDSAVVEVQGNKVRSQGDWMKWIMPPAMRLWSVSCPRSPENSNQEMTTLHLQCMSLDDSSSHNNGRSQTDVHAEIVVGTSSSGDSSKHSGDGDNN